MRVDFYQLSRDPVDRVVALLAAKVMQAGERLVVVTEDADQRRRISETLWAQDGAAFLAHGDAGEGDAGAADAARQPILLSAECAFPNGARMAILADGKWREEAATLDRAMLLFDNAATDAARDLWRVLDAREAIDNRIFKQRDDGGWREGR
ncbi:DNA polymerase III subunit chi [Qipengyuania marisflavi]|uniref:DNA polymerase III subunit chi n=1 Tax=Qipengyuania marisflavi TaxID=2486356 RepID=A0A5S3PC86_9SPHN|nr:DNA polymerase III subunit chi [Qipengyuania marisflavi]TMM50375.1 DNA polymerase III subunit chi [Qipengyuania marisflavi]